MQRVYWGAALIAAAALAWSLGTSSARRAPNKRIVTDAAFVGVRPEVLDLGSVSWGTTVEGQFEFANDSNAPIEVKEIDASCGCTVLTTPPFPLIVGPASSFVVPFRFDPGAYDGPRASTLVVRTADGREFKARLDAEVMPAWRITPDRADFGRIVIPMDGPVPEILVEFESATERLLSITSDPAAWFDARMADRGGGRAQILIRPRVERLSPGLHTANVTIQTTSNVRSAANIFARIQVNRALFADYERVALVGDESRRVRFVRGDGSPARIQCATSESPMLAVQSIAPDQISVCNPTLTQFHGLRVFVTDEGGFTCSVEVSAF